LSQDRVDAPIMLPYQPTCVAALPTKLHVDIFSLSEITTDHHCARGGVAEVLSLSNIHNPNPVSSR
jgi:hypothetical protein